MAEGVVVWVLHLRADGIARREVKDNDITFLDFVPTFEAFVFPLWFFDIALSAPRESVLHEWHREWSVGYASAVAHLVYTEKVSYTHGFFQR